MKLATTQLWKINEKNSNKNGVHKTIYWVKSNKKLFSKKKTYKVNNKYKGDWKNDKKNGFGVQIYPNGNKYEGEWYNNKRHGKGTYWILNQRNKLIRQYTGKWENDKKNGTGTIFFLNGDRYDGFWVDNKMSGYGRLVYNNKDIYIGMWYNGKKNGYGFLTTNNGDHFEGNWVEDKREGFGSYYYKKNGKVIVGEWVDDSPKTAVYCDVNNENNDKDDIFENLLKIPDLELEDPVGILKRNLFRVKEERLLFRIKKSPIHLLFKEEELEQFEDFFEGVLEKQNFFNSDSIFAFYGEFSVIDIEDINGVIKELEFNSEDLNLEEFLKTIYYITKKCEYEKIEGLGENQENNEKENDGDQIESN